MTKYLVTIEETFTYNLEIEASSKEAAEDRAFRAPRYVNNDWDDNDSVITQIDAAPIEYPEREHEIIVTGYVELAHQVVRKKNREVVAAFTELSQAQDFIIMIEGE